MTKAELLALASRVEELTGPDREADAEILCLFSFGQRGALFWNHDNSRVRYDDPIAYTSSVDAALTLVPEAWFWRMMPSENRDTWLVEVWDGHNPGYSAEGDTPALALTAASLRAIAEGME